MLCVKHRVREREKEEERERERARERERSVENDSNEFDLSHRKDGVVT